MAGRRSLSAEEDREKKIAQVQFGKNLTEAMKWRGLDAERLAEAVGRDKDTIYKYMRGDRGPELWILSRLAKALNVAENQLYPGPGSGTHLRVIDGRRR